jgi:hypothetical protein
MRTSSTAPTAPTAFQLRPGLLTAYREDLQRWVVVDPEHSDVWHLSATTVAFVEALEIGWNPLAEANAARTSMPMRLREALGKSEVAERDWISLCRETLDPLREAGLLLPTAPTRDPATRDPAMRAPTTRVLTLVTRFRGWMLRMVHYQLPGGRVPAQWSPQALLARSPQLLLGCLAGVALWLLIWWRLLHPVPTGLLAPIGLHMGDVPFQYPGMSGWAILLLVARTTLHELGHAVLTSTLTGYPAEVGIRLLWGIPRAYTDASTAALVPTRSARLLILVGGVTADAAVGLGLVAILAVTGALPLPLLHFLKYILTATILTNLVPLFRSDGYFILGELTGRSRLREDALDALREAIHDTTAPNADEDSGWLMWYGVIHVGILCLGIGVVAATLSRLLPVPMATATRYGPLAIPLSVTVAVVGLWWHSHHRGAAPADVRPRG